MIASHTLMDNLETLQAMGLTLPSPAYIVGAVLFGIIGIVAYRLSLIHI